MISPLILSRNCSDECLHAEVPAHERSLAGGAGQHRLLFTAGFADLVTLRKDVEINITINQSGNEVYFPTSDVRKGKCASKQIVSQPSGTAQSS